MVTLGGPDRPEFRRCGDDVPGGVHPEGAARAATSGAEVRPILVQPRLLKDCRVRAAAFAAA